MIDKKLLEYLKCLVCEGTNLRIEGEKINCLDCGVNYPIIDDIPLLAKPEKQNGILDKWNLTDYRNIYTDSTPRVANLIRQYTSPKTISLDAGCGLGAYNNYFLGDLISFDIAPFYVREAKRRYDRVGRYFLVADARDIPLRNNILDFVFCGNVLEHFPQSESDTIIKFFINDLSPRYIIVEVPNDSNHLVAFIRNFVYSRAMKEAKKNIIHSEEDHHRIFTIHDLKKFDFRMHGCIGWTSRKKFSWPKFWNLYDKFFWHLPRFAGTLIGIYEN